MNREAILAAIQAIALRNKGIAPGSRQFEVETGVSPGFWRGKFWLTWGDAVREAGLSPNELIAATDREHLVNHLALLTKQVGRFPTSTEIRF